MNKTSHCAGRLCTSIQLKCKNKFTIKKVLFSINHELSSPKFFGACSIPNMTIKCSTKVLKSQLTPGALQERTITHHIFDEIKKQWCLTKLSPSFQHKTKSAYSLLTNIKQCATNDESASQEWLRPNHQLTCVWWKKRDSQEWLTPTQFLIRIWKKKRACIFSDIPTFIY